MLPGLNTARTSAPELLVSRSSDSGPLSDERGLTVNGDLGLLAGTRPRSGEAGAGAAVGDAEDVVEVRDPRIRWIGHALPRPRRT